MTTLDMPVRRPMPAGAEITAQIIYLPAPAPTPPAAAPPPVAPAVVVKPLGGRGRHRAARRRLRITYQGLVWTGLIMIVASGAGLGWIFLRVGA